MADGLGTFFSSHPRIALGYSGGTDSAFLLHEAVGHGADVLPVMVRTAFCTPDEVEDASRLCSDEGLDLVVIDLDVLSSPEISSNGADRCYHCKRAMFSSSNGADRCYHCKRAMFSALISEAAERGYREVMDGTNASDPEGDRPGMRAIRELGVLSPLKEFGITKEDIRRMSREAGLPTWDRATNSCLATRVDTGIPLNRDILGLVLRSEEAVASLGFSGFRVRTDGMHARLQTAAAQHGEAERRWDELRSALAPMFRDVRLDDVTR